MTTEYKNKKSADRATNQADKHYRQTEDDSDDEYVREYYTSNDNVVRNGVYGTVYPFNNGSAETSQLFKVIDATGRCDSSGIRLKNRRVNKSSNLVYYSSPAEYMQHRKVKVQKNIISEWNERINDIMEKHHDKSANLEV